MLGIEDRGKNFIIHLNETAGFFGRAFGFRSHRRNALTDETGDVVENIRIVWIDTIIVMQSRGVRTPRHVLPGKHRVNARHGARLLGANGENLRVRMGRTKYLEMEHPLHFDVCGVASRARDDGMSQRILQAGATGMTSAVFLDGGHTMQRILDGMISGTTTQISFESEGKILLLLFGKAGGGHDHPRGAEAALKSLRVEESLLHRMQIAIAGQSFNGRHLAIRCAKGGYETTVDWLAVEPHRAGTAITRVAALFHPEPSQIASESPQTLPRPRLRIERFSVDFAVHWIF